ISYFHGYHLAVFIYQPTPFMGFHEMENFDTFTSTFDSSHIPTSSKMAHLEDTFNVYASFKQARCHKY
ncbi:unnamed protein product, partial [Onchocerca ochengi]